VRRLPDAIGDARLHRDTAAARGVRHRGPMVARRRWVFDVKTIFGGGGCYLSAQAAEQQSGAVAARALLVESEYRRHAQRLDAQHSPPGTTPVVDAVRGWGGVRALVFGQYGEWSADVHDLLDGAADSLARRRWAAMGARTQAEARSYFVSRLRRRLALVTAREMARHRLNRVQFIGMPRAAVEARMRARVRTAAAAGGDGSVPRMGDFHGWQVHNFAPDAAAGA
jgi:hypothetical protein